MISSNRGHLRKTVTPEGGFTLIELLVSIFIFAVVVGLVYGSYRATFHVIGGTEKQITVTRQAALAFERLREDVGSMVTGDAGELKGEKTDDDGLEGFSFSFISAQHLPLQRDDHWMGRARITYYTKIDEVTGLLDLYRDDTVLMAEDSDSSAGSDGNEAAEPGGYVVIKGLKGAKVSYFSADNESSTTWESSQEDGQGNVFPVLIAINMDVAATDREEAGWLFRTAVALRSFAQDRDAL